MVPTDLPARSSSPDGGEEETEEDVDVVGSGGNDVHAREEVDVGEEEEDLPLKPAEAVAASSFLPTSLPGGEKHKSFFKSSLASGGSSKKSKVSGPTSPSLMHPEEDGRVGGIAPGGHSGTRVSSGSSKGKRSVFVGDDRDQVGNTSDASLFDGTNSYNASRFRFHVPSVGDVQVPDYFKYIRGVELSNEMPSVTSGNVYVPPCPMDATNSYYLNPGDVQGLASNITTPVDQEFFDSLGWSNLKAESMSATLRVSFRVHASFSWLECFLLLSNSCVSFCRLSSCRSKCMLGWFLNVPLKLMVSKGGLRPRRKN